MNNSKNGYETIKPHLYLFDTKETKQARITLRRKILYVFIIRTKHWISRLAL